MQTIILPALYASYSENVSESQNFKAISFRGITSVRMCSELGESASTSGKSRATKRAYGLLRRHCLQI